MIKQLLTLSIFIISSLFSYAEWKTDIAEYLCYKHDFKGAIDYLIAHFEEIDEFYKPEVCGLLSYSFNKINDKNNEHRWIIEYFETYKGRDAIFNFLDDLNNAAMTDYMKSWRKRYPWITDISLLNIKTDNHSAPPAQLPIGIDIKNDTFYKLSHKKDVIQGGLFKGGFNTIRIETNNFFDKSGNFTYFLDLKADDLILRKQIEINIELQSQKIEKKSEEKIKDTEYKLSMFIGDQLIVSSKKIHQKKPSIKLKPPSTSYHPGPDYPLKKNDPFLHSFSIFDLVSGIQKLIKNKKAEEESKKVKKSIQKYQQITLTFTRKDLEGEIEEIKAVVKLETKIKVEMVA